MDSKEPLSDDEPVAKSVNQSGLIDQIRLISAKLLAARVGGMFNDANKALTDLANEPDNAEDYGLYMDGVRVLGQQRQKIEATFAEKLDESFTGFMQGLGARQSDEEVGLESMELSLVEEDELEESLVLVDMGEKANNRYPEELYAIEQRFDAVITDFDVDIDKIPVVPRMICHTFGESVEKLEIDPKVKLVIYKLFKDHVLANLKPLYDEINDLFIKADVLPKLKRSVKKQPESEEKEPEPKPQQEPQSEETGWLDDETVAAPQAPAPMAGPGEMLAPGYLLNTLNQLLADQVPGEMSSTGRRVLASEEMVQALANVKFNTAPVDTSVPVEELKASLVGEMTELKKAGEYTPLDRSIIDIVTLLFDYILDDNNLPSAAKAILARLQMPMLKVAMQDSELFSSKEHIARQFLDKLAKAAVGLADDADSENSPVIKKIDEMVNRVLADFGDDTSLFEELLKEFNEFLEQQAAEEEAVRQEGLAQLKEKEKRSEAGEYVNDYLASYLHDRDIPRPAYELIEGLWKEVMTNTYLDEGAESDLWKDNLNFIDELLWSIDPVKKEEEKKRMVKVIAGIVSTLNKTAEQMDFPREKLDKILAELGEFHIMIMRQDDDAIKHSSVVRVKVDPEREVKTEREAREDISRELDAMRESLAKSDDMDTILNDVFDGVKADKKTPTDLFVFDNDSVEEVNMSVLSADEKRKPAIDDEYWRMVIDMEPGQWVNLTEKDGEIKRARLSWKSEMLGECTFTNWRFKVVADLNFNQLAARLRNGKAALVENLPLFERAFDTVMDKLKGASKVNDPQPG
jgi:hypothetical protein